MAELKLNISDTAGAADQMGGAAPTEVTRKPYLVTAESGVFKRGLHHPKGSLVELDAKTAATAIEAGDVAEYTPQAAQAVNTEVPPNA